MSRRTEDYRSIIQALGDVFYFDRRIHFLIHWLTKRGERLREKEE
jgi:hypothetical protein